MLKEVDQDAARFARALRVELMSIRQIDEWERALAIPPDLWPARSDYSATEYSRAQWRKRAAAGDPSWVLFRDIFAFLEVDGWLTFRYGSLNRLIRHLEELGNAY